MLPFLARIAIYPIKSLDAVTISEATIQSKGSLAFDRRFALLDLQGRFMNGKRSPKLQQVRVTFASDLSSVTVSAPEASEVTFRLPAQGASLAGWIGKFLGEPLVLSENSVVGFPDDLEYPGPTLISTATLQTVADWFEISLDEVRGRFRANLEIDGVPPFWEDRLVPAAPGATLVRIGSTELLAGNICMRCPVPTRDSTTGVPTARFVSRFTKARQESLPDWSPKSRFDTFYRLAINMDVAPNAGDQQLKLGDEVQIGDFQPLERSGSSAEWQI